MTKKSKIRAVILFFILIFGLLLIVALWHDTLMYRLTSSRQHCLDEAKAKLGSDWDKPLELTQEEKEQFPGVARISAGMRETLKCEQETKFFFLF